MIEISDRQLLDKYCIPNMGLYSTPGSELCNILRRLDKNHRLDEADKSWIKSKGMFHFHSFILNWETTGKADFSSLQRRKKEEKIKSSLYKLSEKLGWVEARKTNTLNSIEV